MIVATPFCLSVSEGTDLVPTPNGHQTAAFCELIRSMG